MITLQNVALDFGGRYLYRDVNWQIVPKERIGLVGMNGTGKSTLLKLINGNMRPTEGSISRIRDLKIGFLNQDLLELTIDEPILDVAESAFSEALAIKARLDQLEHEVAEEPTDEWLHEHGDLLHRYQLLDGYQTQAKAAKVLEGLGFTTAELAMPFRTFSGGWRMRVMLAKLLLEEPHLLMLDEPTNHLDLPSIDWLEGYLTHFPGAVIVVSHDRHFLNRVCNKIVEITNQQLDEYPGDFEHYLEEKALRMEQRLSAYQNQQQYIKSQEAFINRFKAKASKATAAQSRVRLLERLERIDAPEDERAPISFSFRLNRPSGKTVVTVQNVSKSYGNKHILERAEGEVLRGEKIALIGANGLGKSTLLRLIAGENTDEGSLQLGHQVNMAFFAQHQLEALHPQNTLMDELMSAVSTLTDRDARTLLGCFLFTGDDVFKKIHVLSGGEKSRVALAKVIAGEANFLLLDEPTNHLDMRSVEVLAEAIRDYEGTVLMVSHDRHFIQATATRIWCIEDRKILDYPGTWDEFEPWYKKRQAQRAQQQKEAPVATAVKGNAAPAAQVSKNQLSKLENDLSRLEQEINRLNAHKVELEATFARPDAVSEGQAMKDLQEAYFRVQEGLNQLNLEYEQAFEALAQAQGG